MFRNLVIVSALLALTGCSTTSVLSSNKLQSGSDLPAGSKVEIHYINGAVERARIVRFDEGSVELEVDGGAQKTVTFAEIDRITSTKVNTGKTALVIGGAVLVIGTLTALSDMAVFPSGP